jgi:hypothetical protein
MGQVLITNAGDSEITISIEQGHGSRYNSETRKLQPGQATEATIGGDRRVSVVAPKPEVEAEQEAEATAETTAETPKPRRRRAATKAE